LLGGFASDQNPSAYSDEGWSVVTLDQLVDKALGDAEHVGELRQRDSGTHIEAKLLCCSDLLSSCAESSFALSYLEH